MGFFFRITRRRTRRMRVRRRPIQRNLKEGDLLFYLGKTYRLHILNEKTRSQGCSLEGDTIKVNLHETSLSERALQEEVRLELLLWYKKEARTESKNRLDQWSQILGVKYGRHLITNPSSLWGSCNAANDIRINWRIIMAPLPLMDYLVAHELCHVVHKNHSARFWQLLTSVMPDCKERRRQLRSLGPQFIL